MTYQTFWPSSLPRNAPEYASETYFRINTPIAPTIVGGGSWSDGSDTTYVSLWNDEGAGGSTDYGSIVAADFDPIPTINTNGGAFISLGLVVRLQGAATSPSGTMLFALYDSSGTNIYQGRGSDFLNYGPPLPLTSPTTVSSPPDEDLINDASVMNYLLTDTFTLVVAATDWTDWAGSPLETWRIFEFGLVFDILGAPVVQPLPYRARQRLHPIAPARRWPREAWRGSSARRAGGYR